MQKLSYLTVPVVVLAIITGCTDSPTVLETPTDAGKPVLKTSNDDAVRLIPNLVSTADFWTPTSSNVDSSAPKVIVTSRKSGTHAMNGDCAGEAGDFPEQTIIVVIPPQPGGRSTRTTRITGAVLHQERKVGTRFSKLNFLLTCTDDSGQNWDRFSADVETVGK